MSSIRCEREVRLSRLFRAISIFLSSSLLLTACSLTFGGHYASIDDLVRDYEAAGEVCFWERTDVVTAAIASGNCGETGVLSLYEDEESAKLAAIELAKSLTGYGLPVNILYGANWIINDSSAADLQKKLGGTLLEY